MLKAFFILQGAYPKVQALLPIASTIDREWVEKLVAKYCPAWPAIQSIHIVDAQAEDSLRIATCAMVCSGTATLQAALLECPQVVLYKTSPLTYALLKRCIRVAHICIVNILAGKRLVPEFIQSTCRAEHISRYIDRFLMQKSIRNDIKASYRHVHALLCHPDTNMRGAERVAQVTLSNA